MPLDDVNDNSKVLTGCYDNIVQTDTLSSQGRTVHNMPDDNQCQSDNFESSKNCLSCDYVMFLIDMTCCCLILVGLLGLLVLALTVGVPYFPIISALSAQQLTTCALSAVTSVATGAIGLALSCFFRPQIETSTQNQASDQAFKSCCLC